MTIRHHVGSRMTSAERSRFADEKLGELLNVICGADSIELRLTS